MNVSINIQQHFFPFKKISEKKHPPPKKSYFGWNYEAIFNK